MNETTWGPSKTCCLASLCFSCGKVWHRGQLSLTQDRFERPLERKKFALAHQGDKEVSMLKAFHNYRACSPVLDLNLKMLLAPWQHHYSQPLTNLKFHRPSLPSFFVVAGCSSLLRYSSWWQYNLSILRKLVGWLQLLWAQNMHPLCTEAGASSLLNLQARSGASPGLFLCLYGEDSAPWAWSFDLPRLTVSCKCPSQRKAGCVLDEIWAATSPGR